MCHVLNHELDFCDKNITTNWISSTVSDSIFFRPVFTPQVTFSSLLYRYTQLIVGFESAFDRVEEKMAIKAIYFFLLLQIIFRASALSEEEMTEIVDKLRQEFQVQFDTAKQEFKTELENLG